MGCFINVSNHASVYWDSRQTEAATAYGSVEDMPFPQIDPRETSDEIDRRVEDYFVRIMEKQPAAVMVQGEYIFTYRLVQRLKAAGVKVLAGRSERRSEESVDENGNTVRRSLFVFQGFMEY